MANKIQGLDKLLRQFENLKNIDKQKVGMASAELLFKKTQDTVPVDTGELKDSGEVVPSDDGGEVSYNTPYVVYVEMDTAPFMRPAIDENMDGMIKAAKKKLQQLIKEAV